MEETFDERKEQDNARQYRQWLSCMLTMPVGVTMGYL